MFENLTSRRRLPSLTALRAFEAMGRLESATRAATELHVTHSAVSRQVKALEHALGVQLFEGPKSRLALTVEGRTLLNGLTPAFDALSQALDGIRDTPRVTLAIHASLAVKWLIPRLPDFERRHPYIDLSVRDLPTQAVKARDADLVMRFLDATSAGDPAVHVLATNRIGMVVAAGKADGADRLPRLVAESHPRAWSDWAAIAPAATSLGPERRLSHLHYVLDAALSGLGVAVLPEALVAPDVASGRLVAPHGFAPDNGTMVAIVMRPEPGRAVRAVLRWLKSQV